MNYYLKLFVVVLLIICGFLANCGQKEEENAKDTSVTQNVEEKMQNLTKLKVGETAVVTELVKIEENDPYTKMALNMGIKPNMQLTLDSINAKESLYIFLDKNKNEFGLPFETCKRILIK